MTAVQAVPERQAVPDGSHRLQVLDGYRALAALAVVMTHVGFQTGAALRGPWAGWLARLDVGVTLFFLLSGFLLFGPHSAAHLHGSERPALRPYLWRRALRLLPAYWLALVAAAAIIPENHHRAVGDWVTQVLFLQIYVPDQLLPGLTQMWSLATEVSFYLFLPVLGLVVCRLGGRSAESRLRRQLGALAAVAVVSLAYRWASFTWWPGSGQTALLWLPAYLDWFAVGMAMASLRNYGRRSGRTVRFLDELARAPGVCCVLALCTYWLATTNVAGPLGLTAPTMAQSFVRHLLYLAVASFALLPAMLGRGAGTSLLSSPPALFLGRVSYGIFLWNMAMVFLAFRLLNRPYFHGGFPLVLLVTLALTIGAASASWYAVERPALALRGLGDSPGRRLAAGREHEGDQTKAQELSKPGP
jgi:peptidoglycan/LPS O-acetylase OafA/YrhL